MDPDSADRALRTASFRSRLTAGLAERFVNELPTRDIRSFQQGGWDLPNCATARLKISR
jgi:hypothetical protein